VTEPLPPTLADLPDVAVKVLRRVYDQNAERYDEPVGDDGVTFAVSIYRNSWFQLEEAFKQLPGWRTARPRGSLVISRGEFRIHVYRWGQDEQVDLDGFRLDEAQASATKRSIAEANSDQLTLFDATRFETEGGPLELHLPNLVVVHAGNPDDGCCGIWVGAPVTTEQATSSPWAWIEPLWLIARPQQPTAVPDVTSPPRHDQLPEPDLDIALADDEDSESAAGEK
jgi:hypothetical protein